MKKLIALLFLLSCLLLNASVPIEIQGRLQPAVASASLEFRPQVQNEDKAFVTQARDGQFKITLPPGRYSARCFAPGLTLEGTTVMVGEGTDHLTLSFKNMVSSVPNEVHTWLASHAIPLKGVEPSSGFADLEPLKLLIGKSTIVGLGESTHGTREFFRLKHRLLEFLVEQGGFQVLAMEAPFAEMETLNEFIQTGKGDPATCIVNLGMWPWATKEVLDMVLWMRKYNEDPSHLKKLQIYGFDVQDPHASFLRAKQWLTLTAPEEAKYLQTFFDQIEKLPASPYATMARELKTAWIERAKEIDSILVRLNAKRQAFEMSYPKDMVELYFQDLRQLAHFVAVHCPPDGDSPGTVRDKAMAETIKWIQSRETDGKMVLWAHNAHVGLDAGKDGSPSMGSYLRHWLGKDYLSIALCFREGSFQAQNTDIKAKGLKVFDVTSQEGDGLGEALASTKSPVLALDLRTLPESGPVKKWFEAPVGMWGIGAAFGQPFSPSLYLSKIKLLKRFDGLLFVNQTTASNPLPASQPSPADQFLANLGFERVVSGGMAQGWAGGGSSLFAARVVEESPKEGLRCMKLVNASAYKSEAPFSVTQKAEARPCRINRIRVTAWVRKEDGKAIQAGIWIRIGRENGRAFFKNTLGEQAVKSDWTRVVLEAPKMEDATELTLGCLAVGTGAAWFDGIQIEWIP